jgi:hypothetical protein
MNKITFLQAYNDLADVFPLPEPGTKNVPNWYREQPAIAGENPSIPQQGNLRLTVKKCQAFFDAMSIGYILKVPVDIYIDTTEGKFELQIPAHLQRFSSLFISEHSAEQISHLPFDKDIYCDKVLRIHPTWMVQTDEGYSTIFMNPMHQESTPLNAVEAIIDTDKFWSDGHLSFLVKKNFKGIIKQGTPMIQVLPFKREEWEMEIDKTFDSGKTEEQRARVRSTFQNGYRLKFWQKKTFK